jgi:hypothetical protein
MPSITSSLATSDWRRRGKLFCNKLKCVITDKTSSHELLTQFIKTDYCWLVVVVDDSGDA